MTGHLNTWADRSYVLVVVLLACLGILVLVGPVIVVRLTSFTPSAALKFPSPDFSGQWYVALFGPTRSRHIHNAAYNSLWVAALATGAATLLGVPAALAIARVPSKSARVLE